MKLKRKTLFSKFYFSNLVICWCKKGIKTALFKKKVFNLNILNDFFYQVVSLEIYTQAKTL